MRLLSSLVVALAGCGLGTPDPIVICHNANCAGTGQFEDDTIDGLRESLALTTDGRPTWDGIEVDTFLYFDGHTSTCLFAHDDHDPATSATPAQAAELIGAFLEQDKPSWNGERFYYKIELKPTVSGTDLFHTGPQLQQHAECVLDLLEKSVAHSRHPVTVIFDSTSECLHNEIDYRLKEDRWAGLVGNSNLSILYSGPIVPERTCIPPHLDIRTMNVRRWRDESYEAIRPMMAWLDARSENTETMGIMRKLEPEFLATSMAPYARGWLNGYSDR